MKKLLIAVSVIFATTALNAQHDLPYWINVRVTNAIIFTKDSSTSNSQTIDDGDAVSYDKTKLGYMIDFERGIVQIKRRNRVIAKQNIISAQREGSKITLTLNNADAVLEIDLIGRVLVYGYMINGTRTVKISDEFDFVSIIY
jgi:hypothetical protein